MKIERYDMIVIGAGPAGLSAAIEAAKKGLKPIVFDENAKPGGQLFKQIHKFFGSKEHKAKVRGFKIGQELLAEAEKYGVEVVLNAIVVGLYPEKEVTVKVGDKVSKGQVLGIVEAMKLMNEIESEFDGTVRQILVENEQMVEFGQPMFVIE